MRECLLCCEEKEYYSVGRCNHMNICYICTIKLRRKTNNNKCAVCNVCL